MGGLKSAGGFPGRTIPFRILLLTFLLIMDAIPAGAKEGFGKYDILCRFSGPQNAIVIADRCGNIIYADNADKLLIPASSLKVFTAVMALARLGPDFRFITEFYTDAENNLTIKGYGDPLLISEAVDKICSRLSGSLDGVHDLVIDSTFFKESVKIPGARSGSLQPYDAPCWALCVNFNTICFSSGEGCPVSAEPQTPLLPMAVKRIRETGVTSGRILLADGHAEAAQYAGELFAYFLEKNGVKTTGEIRCGAMDPSKDRLVYRHESEYPLTEVVRRLLKYSNNFIANQLFLTVGAHISGPPACLKKSVQDASRFAELLGIDGMVMAEGSGISRENRISARMFIPILKAFAPYHDLMTRKGRIYFKTGTLNGITARVGYIQTDSGNLLPFAVMMNDPETDAADVMRTIRRINLEPPPCTSLDH